MSHKTIYGLVGCPLGHSFSRDFFNEMFVREGIDAEYLNFELPDIGDLMELLSEIPNLAGFNVTIPYKEQIIPYMDEMDGSALLAGAVNVVKVDWTNGEPHLTGFNTDITGFTRSISPLLSDMPEAGKALVLGTGGAAKAVCAGLKELGVEPQNLSRNPNNGVLTYGMLTPEIMHTHRIIVNATPAGMYPNIDTCPDIPYDLIEPPTLCFDLVYNPAETMFMRKAAEHGATVKNGLEMLHIQALEAWKIWSGTHSD